MNDLDFSETDYTFVRIKEFNGILDGNGHYIKNIKLTKYNNDTSMFTTLGSDAIVKNIIFENISVENVNAAAVITSINISRIENCGFVGTAQIELIK